MGIHGNYIECFPMDLPYLYRMERLVASKNNISELPNDLWKMKGLELLDISDNLLTSMPESIAKLTSIKELIITSNKIASFPTAIQTLQQKGVKVDIQSQDQTKQKRYMEKSIHYTTDETVGKTIPEESPSRSDLK